MEFSHKPVLLKETIDLLNIREDGNYIDCTTGGAGHSIEIAKRLLGHGHLLCIDRDIEALQAAKSRLSDVKCNLEFIHSNYCEIERIREKMPSADGILMDLGVSSYQLDNPSRGFSYMNDGPLDMRMDASDGPDAFDVVNNYSESDLARVIRDYGEEKFALRIAKRIVRERNSHEIKSTQELSEIIKSAIPAASRREGPHPAKRTFQAIRIEVNDELSQLKTSISALIDLLSPGGRLAIITFHSLEDRIVKNEFDLRLNPCTCPKSFPVCVCGKVPDVIKITGKPVRADEAELMENPRARSAKLRVIQKL